MYTAHLEKGCMLLGIGSDWKTRTVSAAGHGLAKAGDKTGSPRPAITRGQLIELMQRRGWGDQFAVLIFLSWTFLLRIPSEALPLRRQRAGQDLESDERLEARAVIGLVDNKLIIKLNRRKHMASGSRMIRVCVCEDYAQDSLELRAPQLYCPVCHLWPAICRSTPVGQPLFPSWTGKLVLTELRSVAHASGWTQAAKLGTHSVRRGAARAILEAGGSFSQLLRAGQWHSSAYKLYLDMGREETTAVSSLLADASDDEV